MKRTEPGETIAPPNPRRAFSIIEFIGVLTILSILAGALFPVVIRRIDMAARTKEIATLSAMTDGYIRYVLRSNNIPDPGNWADNIASQLALAPADVATNSRRYARAFFVDRRAWFYGNTPY